MSQITEILTGARGLLATPDRWLQKSLYRTQDKSGDSFAHNDTLSIENADRVTGVCTVGAIYATLPKDMVTSLRGGMTWDEKEPMHSIHGLLKQAVWELYETKVFNIIEWQDGPNRTHAQVLAVFDRAIELAQDEDDWRIPVMTTDQIDQVAESVAESFTLSEAPAPVDPALLLV